MVSGRLAGRRILVVEDEYLLADDTRSTLLAAGANVAGLTGTVAQSRAIIEKDEQLDGVLLDINLRGETTFELADALAAQGVPFAFVTGYELSALPERFLGMPGLEKPVQPADLVDLAERLFTGER